MADRNDIRISNNAGWTGQFLLTDAAGAARDLTGATFEMDIRETADDATTLATLTSGNSRVALSNDPTDGTVTLTVPKDIALTLAAGRYVYDLVMTIGGVTSLVTWGSFTVREGVSR